MNRFNAAALCLLLAAGCGGDSGSDTKPGVEKEFTFVSGALLIPGDGSPPIEEATMIIEDGVITHVGKKREFFAPKGALPVELDGKTITPLFINLHSYPGLGSLGSFGAKNYKRESLSADLNRYGYYGVGAVLAGGDADGLAFQLRDELREGKTTGAQLYSSGRGIAARGSSGVMGDLPILISNAADGRKAVSELADRNVDSIVLWAEGMKADASGAVIDEAHKRKLKVFADAPHLAEAKDVAKAGVDVLISGVRDREVDDELISVLKEKNIPVAPALTALEARFMYADRAPWLGEQAMREVYPSGLSAYLSDPVVMNRFRRNPKLASYRQEFSTASANLKKLADAGVTIALGSGSGLSDTFPGYFEHRELELMVNAGISAADAIKAATSVSAEALGVAELGTLAVGKRGSFIVFSNNPAEKITNSKGIDYIFMNGQEVDRLEMIRQIKMDLPKVTQQDRANEAAIQQKEAQEAAEARMKHYGKFALGQTLSLGPGLAIQTPLRSNPSSSAGPPVRVTVALANASGADLREFYAKVLPPRWNVAGDCWERAHPLQEGKKYRLCAQPSQGQIVLTISVQ